MDTITLKNAIDENDNETIDSILNKEYPATMLEDPLRKALKEHRTDIVARLVDHMTSAPPSQTISDIIKAAVEEERSDLTAKLIEFENINFQERDIAKLIEHNPDQALQVIDDLSERKFRSFVRSLSRRIRGHTAELDNQELRDALIERVEDGDADPVPLAEFAIGAADRELFEQAIDLIDDLKRRAQKLFERAVEADSSEAIEIALETVGEQIDFEAASMPRAEHYSPIFIRSGQLDILRKILDKPSDRVFQSALNEYARDQITMDELQDVYDEFEFGDPDAVYIQSTKKLDPDELSEVEEHFENPTIKFDRNTGVPPAMLEYLYENDRIENPEWIIAQHLLDQHPLPDGVGDGDIQIGLFAIPGRELETILKTHDIDLSDEVTALPESMDDELRNELEKRDPELGEALRAHAIEQGDQAKIRYLDEQGYAISDSPAFAFFAASPRTIAKYVDELDEDKQDALIDGLGDRPIREALNESDGYSRHTRTHPGESVASALIAHGFEKPGDVQLKNAFDQPGSGLRNRPT